MMRASKKTSKSTYKVPFNRLVPGRLYESDTGDVVLCLGQGMACLLWTDRPVEAFPRGLATTVYAFGVLFRDYQGALEISND